MAVSGDDQSIPLENSDRDNLSNQVFGRIGDGYKVDEGNSVPDSVFALVFRYL